MKKRILIIVLCITVISGIVIYLNMGNHLGGDDPLKDHANIVFSISQVRKKRIPVKLTLYEDGTYELFTAYFEPLPWQVSNLMLTYTKSIKGKYDYDILKILEDDSIKIDEYHETGDISAYDIYMGASYIENGYDIHYIIEKGKTNKYLDELLDQIDINLNLYANADYSF